jgi:hypothetical protein
MKTIGLRNFFPLVFVQRIAQDFLALFRFTEADACSILSAYGLHNLEVDRLQNNRPNEQEERWKLMEGKLSEADRQPSSARECQFK